MQRHKHHSHHLPVVAWVSLTVAGTLFALPWGVLLLCRYFDWVQGVMGQ
jgi:hypothetical protein